MKGVATLECYSATPSPDPEPAGGDDSRLRVERWGTGLRPVPPGFVAPAGATVAGITSLTVARAKETRAEL
jgi:hypothetical protein